MLCFYSFLFIYLFMKESFLYLLAVMKKPIIASPVIAYRKQIQASNIFVFQHDYPPTQSNCQRFV